MFNGKHSRAFIENIYLKNDKNFEKTLDLFLTDRIPKENELEVIVTESKKDEPSKDTEMIDTSSKPKMDASQFKGYLMEEYGDYFSTKRKNKNKQYYEQ
jgi:hypothetical protein